MFEKALKDNLERIFKVKKLTYDLPGESNEQECMFIEVTNSVGKKSSKVFKSKVTGKIAIFANSDKIPYGFFEKKIQEASKQDVAPFYFYDFTENTGKYRNIVERTMSFIYFFSGQYDPETGSITSVTIEET